MEIKFDGLRITYYIQSLSSIEKDHQKIKPVHTSFMKYNIFSVDLPENMIKLQQSFI